MLDLLFRDPGYLSDLFGGIFLRTFFEPVETVAPAFNEVPVIELFFDNHVNPAQSQGCIGAGSEF